MFRTAYFAVFGAVCFTFPFSVKNDDFARTVFALKAVFFSLKGWVLLFPVKLSHPWSLVTTAFGLGVAGKLSTALSNTSALAWVSCRVVSKV